MHRYLYANDNPTRYTDPTGHAAEERDKPVVPPQVWGIPPGAFVPPIGLTPSSRAAAEYHENLQNAFVGEVAASAGRELAGLAEGAIAVARKTPSGLANDLGLRVAGGQSVGSAIAEIVTENVDPTGSGRRAHAEGKGVLAIAGSVVGGNVENAIEVAKDVLPINQSLRAMDSSLPMADRVEAGFKALSQTSALMAGMVKIGAPRAPSGRFATLTSVQAQVDRQAQRALQAARRRGLSGAPGGIYADRVFNRYNRFLERELSGSGSGFEVQVQPSRNALGGPATYGEAGSRRLDATIIGRGTNDVYSGYDITISGRRWNSQATNADYVSRFRIQEGYVREFNPSGPR